MSLYQCDKCGCLENTACGSYWGKDEALCSACAEPTGTGKYAEFGKWHGRFDRKYFSKGMYITNDEGNLEHKETGELAQFSNGSDKELDT